MPSSASIANHLRAYDLRRRIPIVGLVGFLLVLALQIPYPLLSQKGKTTVTIASVAAFFCTSVVHAWWSRGVWAVVALVGVCAGGGLAIEAIGWRTGFPFGNYRYTNVFGWRILGVPVVVVLAWAMFGWLALLCAQRVGGGALGALIGGAVLLAWDLFLDPQMVRAGGWVWLPTKGPRLNGIPVVNFIGWFFVGVLMVSVLLRLVPQLREGRTDDLGWALLAWTLFSETLLFVWFFHHPALAAVATPALGALLFVVYRLGRRSSGVT